MGTRRLFAVRGCDSARDHGLTGHLLLMIGRQGDARPTDPARPLGLTPSGWPELPAGLVATPSDNQAQLLYHWRVEHLPVLAIPKKKGDLPSMSPREKALYHQIHPLKLLTDISAEILSI